MADGTSPGAVMSMMAPVDDIEIRARLRPVDGAAVEALMASIEQVGLIQPIQLRELEGGLVLIAGAHRLEAHKRLGLRTVRAEVRVCSDDEAELVEIEENLVEAELSTLDLATHLHRQKQLYEALHPETKNGAARWSDQKDTVSFRSAVAAKRDMSERHVNRLTRIGAALGPQTVAKLREAQKPVSFRVLSDLSAESNGMHQFHAAAALVSGQAKRVDEALRLAKGERAPQVKSREDRSLDVLIDAFGRAGKEAQTEFMVWLWGDERRSAALEAALLEQQARAAAADDAADDGGADQ